MNEEISAFANLGPDDMLDAIEATGKLCDGRFIALNSYENRVYQIGIEDESPIVAKFYRPHRWTDEAILEEHEFTLALEEEEIPVIAPIVSENNQTLLTYGSYRFALYPRRGGHPPELDNPDHLEQMGRFIARIHNYGETHSFKHRQDISVDRLGLKASQWLLEHQFIPFELEAAYRSLIDDLIIQIHACFERAGKVQNLRIHGDFHPGNVLWTDSGPHIVDFDDCVNGPAVQDIWMFLSGDRRYQTARLADILEGYTQFRDFEPRELHLIEALRTLRMIHYASWLAKRWNDPAFPKAFPWFNEIRYWEEHILQLREQASLMDEGPLVWD